MTIIIFGVISYYIIYFCIDVDLFANLSGY